MCEYLTNEIANILQMIAWPLELIGLTLVLIEVKWPKTADMIEAWFDKARRQTGFESCSRMQRLMMVSGTFLLLGLIVSLLYYVENLFFRSIFLLQIILGTWGLFLWSLPVLDRWANGRALGAFGAILALLAFSLESYQFAQLLSGCS